MTLADTVKQIAAGQTRHLATAAAGALVTAGWLSSSKTTAFEDAGVSALMLVVILGWSAAEKLWAYVKPHLDASPVGRAAEAVVIAAAPTVEQMAAAALNPAPVETQVVVAAPTSVFVPPTLAASGPFGVAP